MFFAGIQRKLNHVALSALLAAIVPLALVTGCSAKQMWDRDDPQTVLLGFLMSADAQRTDLVWNYLSLETRDVLKQKADAFNANAGANRSPDQMIRFGHIISSTREYKKLEVVEQNEVQATVNIIKHDASVISVVLKKQDGRWTVDLPLDQKKDV